MNLQDMHKRITLQNGMVTGGDWEPVRADLAVCGQRIEAIGETAPQGTVVDVSDCTLIPGFIDIHIHGCAGADTCDATPEALDAMSASLAEKGVTSFCPTSMTLPEDTLKKVFRNVQNRMGKEPGAYIHGIHMEGPYLSATKKGAQNGAYLLPPDPDGFRRLYDACGGCIRLVDIAPEETGAENFVRQVSPYCTVSMAHTAAGYTEAVQAVGWGIRHATHLYNAMSGLSHRNPGVVGAVLDMAREWGIMGELICDGFHIHPAALRIAFAMLGEDNSVVVSDSMRAAAFRDGEYNLGGLPVTVTDGKALLADGTIAASTTNMYTEFCNILSYGIPWRQAVKSTSWNPARAIGVQKETGSLETGKYADIVALDRDNRIRLVMIKGKIIVNNL